MIDEHFHKKIKQYAKRRTKSRIDAEDIAQIACELLIKNPPDERGLSNTLCLVAVQRATFQFYYKQMYSGLNELRNKDVIADDYDKELLTLIDPVTPEQLTIEHEALALLKNLKHYSLTVMEMELLKKIVNGYEPELKDRTHFTNLAKKVNKLLT